MWTDRLTPTQVSEVLALAERARQTDGVDPLNEEARLSLTDDSAQHLLAPADGPVVGYLNWSPRLATAQLVVDPPQRRRGIATSLWQRLPAASAGIWSFGNLPAAAQFANSLGLTPQRSLGKLTRPLAGIEPRYAPSSLTLRGYRSSDAAAVLAVNAAAFAHHAEQGSLDFEGLTRRMDEPWFDPDGLILGFDADGLAGFHWTKVASPLEGEVYVVAVAPRAQGRGYGGVLLAAGLAHLAAQGLPTVVLYVDMAEEIAVRMYAHAGFTEAHRDVFYAASNQEQ